MKTEEVGTHGAVVTLYVVCLFVLIQPELEIPAVFLPMFVLIWFVFGLDMDPILIRN